MSTPSSSNANDAPTRGMHTAFPADPPRRKSKPSRCGHAPPAARPLPHTPPPYSSVESNGSPSGKANATFGLLMLGLKCRAPAAGVVAAARAEDLLTVPAADNVVRLLPPLTLTDDEIAEAVARLDRAAGKVAAPAAG